ncbi:ATP-binding cassette domain-containing protein [Staphylococcus saprophyticus]|nr:ATP-binding cassette domain-containing protein [Staphylococcus saprophyticus]
MDVVDRFIILAQGTMRKQYDKDTFNKLSHETLAELGLRTTHLDKMKPKVHHNVACGTLTLKDFNFKYKPRLPLSINIPKVELNKGKVTAVIGQNGSGKSTFARCLTGVERKFKGKVDNDEVTLKRGHRLNNVYLVFQDVNNQLFAESVGEELRLSHADLDDETIQKQLQYYGISQHIERHPLSLSGGEKQRLAIASAVETSRDILIFDEPSSGLDGQRMREISGIIDDLATNGHTIIVITHDYELLLSCADEILHLENGHVKDQYTMNDANLGKLQSFFEI